jgi:hypothetical protein
MAKGGAGAPAATQDGRHAVGLVVGPIGHPWRFTLAAIVSAACLGI